MRALIGERVGPFPGRQLRAGLGGCRDPKGDRTLAGGEGFKRQRKGFEVRRGAEEKTLKAFRPETHSLGLLEC